VVTGYIGKLSRIAFAETVASAEYNPAVGRIGVSAAIVHGRLAWAD
jgi:hypothetical protein